jgi:phosphoglycerate kinase
VSSHLGRPKGDGPEDKFSLKPCAARLGELLKADVKMAPDCIGDEVKKMVDAMKDGDVILLENTRFYKAEEKNDKDFSKKLSAPYDM